MSSSVFLFPGIYSIVRSKDRQKVLSWVEVRKRAEIAQALLTARGEKRSLMGYLNSPATELFAIENLHLTAIGVLAIQMGITDRLKSMKVSPNWLMGCSLGDLARSVFSGAITFQDAVIHQHGLFMEFKAEKDRYAGYNLGIRATAANPFNQSQLTWLRRNKLVYSKMSPRFISLSCTIPQYKLIRQKAAREGWQVNVSDFGLLLHNSQLKGISERARELVNCVPLKEPEYSIYSSICNRPIQGLADLQQEAVRLLWSPVHWFDAVTNLQTTHQVRHFINIGPCRSLSVLQREISPGCRAVNAVDLAA